MSIDKESLLLSKSHLKTMMKCGSTTYTITFLQIIMS